MEQISKSSKQTQEIGSEFAKSLISRTPVTVGLIGDLGSGKTTFAQGMARGLGINPRYYVNSPTFTMVNEYHGKKIDLIHVDLYRIEKPVEIETLALEEYLHPGRIVVVEWAEKIRGKKPDYEARFEILSPKERRITLT
jgi:tRNA threonylcarbamoyladenosine biosynthesis protein TsaE